MIAVDSSALVAIVTGEATAAALNEVVAAATEVIVPSPCLVETSMVLAGRLGEAGLALLDAFLATSSAKILPFTEDHARAAVDGFLLYGKGRHPAGLNFGGCMAYAVAVAEGAPLLFTGGDFARTDVAVAGSGG